MTALYYESGNELYHYGVKGMKWGRRRYQNPDGTLTNAGKKREAMLDAKSSYKQARKDFNKSYNKAYNRAIAGISPIKKHRQANDDRWDDVYNKANISDEARADYKQAKNAYKQQNKVDKQAIKAKTKELNKNASFGEKLTYNNATRKRAATYMVKNNMTMEQATQKAHSDAKRNTAIILGAYGAYTVASLYAINKM